MYRIHKLDDTINYFEMEDSKSTIEIKWTENLEEDYKGLADCYFRCGYEVFKNVIESGHDNIKSDMWFLPAVYLLRQAIELEIKSILFNSISKRECENIFEVEKHNLYSLWLAVKNHKQIQVDETQTKWLENYLMDLESIDEKSDVFRFPFDDKFLSQYAEKFLSNVDVANNLIQAFGILVKINCIEYKDLEFDDKLMPKFFVFAKHGIGNCSLWQARTDDGFHKIVEGYLAVSDFLFYDCNELNYDVKILPILFLVRNSIELGLKRIFYSRVENGVDSKLWRKRKSHLLKKDLWKAARPVIEYYGTNSDSTYIDKAEKIINELNKLDKNGDTFRYPTTYSFVYKLNGLKFDAIKIYEYFQGLAEFLSNCNWMLQEAADYESEKYYEW